MTTTAIVPGSLAAVANQQNQSLAESFLSADAIVLIDVSGSMTACDVPGEGTEPLSRYDAACHELSRLQASIPGRIAVVAFSDRVEFIWGGRPPFYREGTDMAKALQFVKAADGCGMRIILISDGEPNDAKETLQVAKTFQSPIDTVFIGDSSSLGADFLKRLSAAAGGQSATKTIPQLASHIAGLLA
jgi:Mg-chelatase subunit ChlD